VVIVITEVHDELSFQASAVTSYPYSPVFNARADHPAGFAVSSLVVEVESLVAPSPRTVVPSAHVEATIGKAAPAP